MTPTYPLDALARLAAAAGYNARGEEASAEGVTMSYSIARFSPDSGI